MTIASEITRLQNDKAAMCAAIENKWVTVGNVTFDDYASCIDAIPSWAKVYGVKYLIVWWGWGGAAWYWCSWVYTGWWGGGWGVEMGNAETTSTVHSITVWAWGCGGIGGRCGCTCWCDWNWWKWWDSSALWVVAHWGAGWGIFSYTTCYVWWSWGWSWWWWGGGKSCTCSSWGWWGACGEWADAAWYNHWWNWGLWYNWMWGGGWGWFCSNSSSYWKWCCGWWNGWWSLSNTCWCLDAWWCGWWWGGARWLTTWSYWGQWWGWVVDICYLLDWSCGFTTATWWNSCYTCDWYCVHRFTSNWTFTIVS